MNLYLFFSIIFAISVAAFVFFVKKEREVPIIIFVVIAVITAAAWMVIGLHDKDVTGMETPMCLEKKGQGKITYLWFEEEHVIEYQGKKYSISKNVRNWPQFTEDVNTSYQDSSITPITHIDAYEYQYRKFLNFFYLKNGDVFFSHKVDDFIKHGKCKQEVIEFKTMPAE